MGSGCCVFRERDSRDGEQHLIPATAIAAQKAKETPRHQLVIHHEPAPEPCGEPSGEQQLPSDCISPCTQDSTMSTTDDGTPGPRWQTVSQVTTPDKGEEGWHNGLGADETRVEAREAPRPAGAVAPPAGFSNRLSDDERERLDEVFNNMCQAVAALAADEDNGPRVVQMNVSSPAPSSRPSARLSPLPLTPRQRDTPEGLGSQRESACQTPKSGTSSNARAWAQERGLCLDGGIEDAYRWF